MKWKLAILHALRIEIAAYCKEYTLTSDECEEFSALTEELHAYSEAAWNKYLTATGQDKE